MKLTVFINFNGKLSTYDEDDSIIEELTGNIRLLHVTEQIRKDPNVAEIYCNTRIVKVEYFFQSKEGKEFFNVRVGLAQINQLKAHILEPPELTQMEEI